MVLHGRVVRKLEALYDEIVAAGHPEPMILPLDLAKAEADDFANVAERAARRSSAASTRSCIPPRCWARSGRIEHQSFDSWLALLRVNVAAPMGLTRALLPLLDAAPDASVVFTLDNRGQEPRAYWGGYAVTKAGVAALARELADEWENRANLRVNAVVPGPIRSPLRGQTHPAEDIARLPAAGRAGAAVPASHRGQTKAESGALIDAQAWLAGAPVGSPRSRAVAQHARAGGGSPPPASMSGRTASVRASARRRHATRACVMRAIRHRWQAATRPATALAHRAVTARTSRSPSSRSERTLRRDARARIAPDGARQPTQRSAHAPRTRAASHRKAASPRRQR